MVDSRENGVLCTVARSWLLFFHNEIEWKNLESNIAWGVMNCTKHFDLSSSLMASCVTRFMICWVCWLHFSELVCLVLSVDERMIKINYGTFCVCFRRLEKVILWSRLWLNWPRTNSDTIVRLFIWLFFIWNDKVKGTVFVLVCIFVDKINAYHLKRWIYGPRAKLSIVSQVLRVLNIP